MPTAFSPSLTQRVLTLPYQPADEREAEQGGVEDKHKQRLSATPPASK